MICASYDHNMPTFEVFLSLFFLIHFFLCMFAKNYTSIIIYEKSFFSLYTYVPIHEKKLFSLYTHVLKNSFSLYRHGLYKISIPFQRFIFPFSIYTHCSYTRISFHIVYIQKFLFFSFYTDMTFCSQRLFFLYSWHYYDVSSFYFRMAFLNKNSIRFRNFNKYYRQ